MADVITIADVGRLREMAAKHAKHSRKCKHAPDDCAVCKSIIAWYQSIPPNVLALVLEDRPKTAS